MKILLLTQINTILSANSKSVIKFGTSHIFFNMATE